MAMKQKLIVLLMFLFTIMIYGQKGSYEVTAPELNIREQANKNSEVLGRLANKQEVEVENIEGNWAEISFTDENGNEKNGYISTKYIVPKNNESSKLKDNTYVYIVSIIGLIGLICYIIALIKTRRGKMTTIANWYDFSLLCASFVIPCLSVFFGGQENGEFSNWAVGGFLVGGLCFLGSIIYSIKENRDNYFHAFLSIMAKLFIVGVILILLFLVFFSGRRTKKRVRRANGQYYYKPLNRYEQQIEDQKYKERQERMASITFFLVLGLIGSHLEVIEYNN